MARQDDFNDELFSAYLDGELSDEERAAVEARLRQDPAAEELVDELKAAAQAVRELPRVAAPQGLKDEIVRAAAGRMRTGAAPTDAGDGQGSPTPVVGGPTWTIGRTRRGWAWGALAVAAALLVMVLSGDGERERELARPAADTAPQGGVRDSLEWGNAADRESSPDSEVRDRPSLAGNRRELLRAAPTADNRETEASERILREEAATALDALAGVGAANVPGIAGETPSAHVELDTDFANNAVAEDGPVTNEQFSYRTLAERNGGGEAEVVVNNADAAFGDQSVDIKGEAPVYFVSVNITPEAARNKAMRQFFGRHSITFVDTTPLSDTQGSNRAALGLARGRAAEMYDMEASQALGGAALGGAQAQNAQTEGGSAAIPRAAGAATEVESETLQQLDGEFRRDQAEPSQAAQAPPTRAFAAGEMQEETAAQAGPISEVVAVEAAPDQVAALLADLAGDRENVRAVAVLGQSRAAPQDVLLSPARFNRNAADAVRQIAGTWRFAPAPQSVGLVADNGAPVAGYRYGAYGGFGGEAAGDARGGAGRYRRGAVTDDDGPPADAYGVGVAPESRSGGYPGPGGASADGARLNYVPPAQQADPSARPADEAASAAADGAEQLESLYKSNVSTGQAWVVSPLQIHTSSVEGRVQLQQQTLSVEEALAGATAREPQAEANGDLSPLADRAVEQTVRPETATGAEPSEPVAPSASRPSSELARGARRQAMPKPPALSAAPADASGERAPPEGPPGPSHGSALGRDAGEPSAGEKLEELARPDSKPATKQVRMLVFFNVIPTGPEPASEAAPQPAGAVRTGDQ